MIDNIIQFYESYDEEGRLFRDRAHLPEYLTTIHYFDRLFTPGSRILDACAGAGRYSFYLADKGHIVTACDLAEHNVEIIKANPKADKLTEIAVCNAIDLSRFEENSFDVVLCMGALYHLESNELKEKAVSECVRICKLNGIVALAYMVGAEGQTRIQYNIYEGIFFGSVPREIEGIALKYGLEKIYNIGTDGIINIIGNRILTEASNEEFQKYMGNHYLTCEEESVVMASVHSLWIGKKKWQCSK